MIEPDQKLFNDAAPIALMAADPDYMARVHWAIKNKPRVICDFETRSYLPLTGKESVGAEKYSEHFSTRIICMSYKIGDAKAKLWWPFFGEAFPFELLECIEDGCIFEAHNAGFERAIWRNIVAKLYGVECPEHWCDTMAVCAYRAIPMKLEIACKVLGLPEQKDKRGKSLINKLCKPTKLLKADKKNGVPDLPDMPGFKWNEDPQLIRELGEYCLQDAEAEYGLGKAVGDLPPPEYEVYRLDQEINDRGVFIDIDAVRAANKIRLDVEEKLTAELVQLTDGMVQTGGMLEEMTKWCAMQGVHMPDMTADTLDLFLSPKCMTKLPPGVRRILEIRQVLSRASAKKLVKFIKMLCVNGRIMGMLQYHGAGTGRWAGRGVQPQNFPRPEEWIMEVVKKWSPKKKKMVGDAQASMELLMTCILTGDTESFELMYGDPMNALANALRGFIIAAPDHELYVADFSAIEARVLAWVAGEQWKLDAFAAIDRGEGYKGSADIYLATASMVYGYPCLDKSTHAMERQTGKTCELAFGYQGGVGAWRKFDDSDKWTDSEVNEKKNAWRDAHPMTKTYWYEIEDAAVQAVLTKQPCSYRGVTFQVVKSTVGDWLACRLPNGRCLWYYEPYLVKEPSKYGKFVGGKREDFKYELHYQGKDNKRGGAWGDVKTYGGMLTENIVQAISRDLMCEAMFRVTVAQYPIILTVHDEIISERRKRTGGSGKEFNALMSIVPGWTPGLPISVAGYVSERYRKD